MILADSELAQNYGLAHKSLGLLLDLYQAHL